MPSEATPRAMICSISAMVSGLSVKTCMRDSSAEMTSKLGFSVVAPMSVSVPSSTIGQEEILLRLVEAVDLIEEKDDAVR